MLEITACAALAAGLAFAQTAGSRLDFWLVSPYGHVDGIMLRDGRSFYFTPDVGTQLMRSTRLGDLLRLDVQSGRRYLVNERDGARTEITPAARGGGPTSPAALQRMSARGHITMFTRMPEGSVTGFVLTTGEQVRVPPTLGSRLAALRIGEMVTIEGLGNRSDWGTGIMALAIRNERGEVVLER